MREHAQYKRLDSSCVIYLYETLACAACGSRSFTPDFMVDIIKLAASDLSERASGKVINRILMNLKVDIN